MPRAYEHLYFVGIGGAGMAPLALLAQHLGYAVSGSDRNSDAKIAELTARGIHVAIGHREDNLPTDIELVIYSSAIPMDNPERLAARRLRLKQKPPNRSR